MRKFTTDCTVAAYGPGITPIDALLDNLEKAAVRHWGRDGAGPAERSWYLERLARCTGASRALVANRGTTPVGFVVYHSDGPVDVLDALYVHDGEDRQAVAKMLLEEAVRALAAMAPCREIENWFYVWPDDYINEPLTHLGFRVVQRLNLSMPLRGRTFATLPCPDGTSARPWAPDFAEALESLLLTTYARDGGHPNAEDRQPAGNVTRRARELIEGHDARFSQVLTTESFRLVAAIMIETWEDDFIVQELCVAPTHRALGCGRFLMHGALRTIAEAGGESVRLTVTRTNETARQYYERLGFQLKAVVPYASLALGQ